MPGRCGWLGLLQVVRRLANLISRTPFSRMWWRKALRYIDLIGSEARQKNPASSVNEGLVAGLEPIDQETIELSIHSPGATPISSSFCLILASPLGKRLGSKRIKSPA